MNYIKEEVNEIPIDKPIGDIALLKSDFFGEITASKKSKFPYLLKNLSNTYI